ncbi:HipA family kinase [Bacillus tuaregi]|uniref:HipA family kinase n=1 Tax=Bacillus tuaregi TaxID=1816695 RepID=UPI0008F893E6|nr:HipA family kinase [Bacillus tuaregi]
MIEPIAYQKKLEGKSNAHLISFNDGKDYVVKYFQPGFEKTLPNEWVSYCLARYLGLPIPFARIIDIPQSYSSQIPELAAINSIPYQFALTYIPDCLDGHQVLDIPKIINSDELASIIVFDYWLYNSDRTRKNILLQKAQGNILRLWAIDHAEVFGTYNWQMDEIENLPVGLIKSATHQIIADFIQDEKEFFEQVDIIQKIPIFLIEEIVSMIPDEWGVTKEEKKAMVNALLMRRKKVLPDLIQKFINTIYRPLHDSKKPKTV